MSEAIPIEMTPQDWGQFWKNVDRSGGKDACWPWTGKVKLKSTRSINRQNYGQFRASNGVTYRANRIALLWMLYKKKTKTTLKKQLHSKKMVCHTCDNPNCCNPRHLKERTGGWNNRDAIRKGRANRKRLSKALVSRFKRLAIRDHGRVSKKLCEQFGISHEAARRIVIGESYAHVPPVGAVRPLRWVRSPPMTPELVKKIRRLHKAGFSLKQIANKTGRKVSAVRDVVMRRRASWGDK